MANRWILRIGHHVGGDEDKDEDRRKEHVPGDARTPGRPRTPAGNAALDVTGLLNADLGRASDFQLFVSFRAICSYVT